MKQKRITEKINFRSTSLQGIGSLFLFSSTIYFFKTTLASRTDGTCSFAQHTSRLYAKQKEPIFAIARTGQRVNSINL